MNCYIVKRLSPNSQISENSDQWNDIDSLTIDNYLWCENDYKPKVVFKVCYTEKGLFLFSEVFEKPEKVKNLEINSKVYEDSAVEFFINLFPHSTDNYFNFEFNSKGVIRTEFGTSSNRKLVDAQLLAKLNPTVKEVLSESSASWQLFCHIPFELFEHYYCKHFAGETAYANFYKCGDKTEFEHYGAWNRVEGENPNFHQPEFFGKLKFR